MQTKIHLFLLFFFTHTLTITSKIAALSIGMKNRSLTFGITAAYLRAFERSESSKIEGAKIAPEILFTLSIELIKTYIFLLLFNYRLRFVMNLGRTLCYIYFIVTLNILYIFKLSLYQSCT